MSRRLKILSICGSGVVTSSMVADKLKDLFDEAGYDIQVTAANSSELEGYIMREKFDLIAYASPIHDNFGIPAISAIGLITGMGEEEFMEEALKAIENKEQ